MTETFSDQIQASAYRKVYWFARYLIDTDNFGGIGQKKPQEVMQAVVSAERLLAAIPFSFESAKALLISSINSIGKERSKLRLAAERLAGRLEEEISTREDLAAFCIAMRHVVDPINSALKRIPSDDKYFVRQAITELVKRKGETGAGEIIALWNRLGVEGCINAERTEVVTTFAALMHALDECLEKRSAIDEYLISTAFVQEFERRLGQKRKTRGGGSLEDVVSFIFAHFGFERFATPSPTHFVQDIEVDKWFRCYDGWSIGISCKRTLRERWKQLSQADRGTLSRFKIKEIWHLITFDTDLTDDKITRLGEQNHIFYLADSSNVYQRCSSHVGMKSYVRPLSQLVSDIRKNVARTPEINESEQTKRKICDEVLRTP